MNERQKNKIIVKDLGPTKPPNSYYSVDLNILKHPELWEGLIGIALPSRDHESGPTDQGTGEL